MVSSCCTYHSSAHYQNICLLFFSSMFLFLPCSRYPNSRKCVHTPLT
ncbi:unnamed protein product [Spirodela intermedia]|uniref:Uncharacterized protein n=1 Tax=Spirodela intermedia TaxID=51605 RepID=A0A7I8J1B8_SPIIN|nr:unnamed protein product [Spirodela intermedia]CAA6663762.1 unnamed protein product [Spirodela intermedia]